MDVPLESAGFIRTLCNASVSILVLVDVPLESDPADPPDPPNKGFNPCFSGCAS